MIARRPGPRSDGRPGDHINRRLAGSDATVGRSGGSARGVYNLRWSFSTYPQYPR